MEKKYLRGFLFVVFIIILFVLFLIFGDHLGPNLKDIRMILLTIWPATLLGSVIFFGLLLANCSPS